MAHGLPGSVGPAASVLFGPFRWVRPMGWMGGRYTTSKPMRWISWSRWTQSAKVPCAPGMRPWERGKSSYQAPQRARAVHDPLELAVVAGAVFPLLQTRDEPAEPGVEEQIEARLLGGGGIVPLEGEAEGRRLLRRRARRDLAHQLPALQQLAQQICLPAGEAALHLLHPGSKDVGPRLDGEDVARVPLERELPGPAVVIDRAHGRLAPARLLPGPVEDHRVQEVVPLLEDVGRDVGPIAYLALAGIPAVVHRRLNALDRDGMDPFLFHGMGPHRQRSTR